MVLEPVEDHVELANTYFNRGGWIDIQIISDGGKSADIEVSSVVIGQTKSMSRYTSSRETRRVILSTFALMAFVIGVALGLSTVTTQTWWIPVIAVGAGIGVALLNFLGVSGRQFRGYRYDTDYNPRG